MSLLRIAQRALSALALFVLALSAGPTFAQSIGGGGLKENLDLPYDALGEGEEEEDAPEVVNFYGQNLEGDAFFYVVDRSGSMQDSGELAVAKKEILRNITEFTERVQFGVVFFDKGLLQYPSSGTPAEANPGMKASAQSFVNTVSGGGGSCCQLGLTAALRMANRATAKRIVITYVGDGGGTCNGADEANYLRETLAAVSAQNFKRAQVNCVGVLNYPKLNEDFMRQLASANGGNYTKITK